MLCAFMCSYSTLPMIGTGCGITTDHLARSGVTGNGARPKCGMPASLATLEIAMDDGVVADPMMMSAFDSVTKRRALVVALVGSPPSSRTMSLSGTPAISFGTNSSALRSGTPSAAAGPVVEIEMPMVISFVCAPAVDTGSAMAAAMAAIRTILFMNFSLILSRRFAADCRQSFLHKFRHDFLRHRRRLQAGGIVGVMPDQHPRLERLDRKLLTLIDLVGHLETRSLETLDPAFDRDPIAVGRGNIEFRPRVDHGNADQAVFPDDILLGEAGRLEHDRGRVVEHFEIARVIDDIGGVAIAPLDLHVPAMNEHSSRPYFGAIRSEASSRTTSPLR